MGFGSLFLDKRINRKSYLEVNEQLLRIVLRIDSRFLIA